jgi:hypothetical protein
MRKWAFLAVLALTASSAAQADTGYTYDVVIYGGTAGGVTAAIQAARMGKSVAIIEPTLHLGGMTTNGLSKTDTGRTDAIQGLAREFYLRCGQVYGSSSPEWLMEPKVAESVLNAWVAELGVDVYRGERLDLTGGVAKTGNVINSILMESGKQFSAGMFIDAGYEGDLMAKAGVTYTVGREANATYGETYNGVQTARAVSHQFGNIVDPYVIPGNPASGLIPYVSADPPGTDGQADNHVQAYNFRLTVTKAANRRAWTAPAGYDAANYEVLLRYIQAQGITGVAGKLLKIDSIRGNKYDVNNQGPVSTDFIGMNYDYPDADHATREDILQAHRNYQQGLLYFLATDPRLPASIRTEMNSYGLTIDEFTDNDGWSGQMYIREARRMVGEYVMTDNDCLGLTTISDSIALGSYNMDSHNTQRYVTAGGAVRNEGDIQKSVPGPYLISYGSITPLESEAANLLVTSAVSASHIAYGSIRMEPVFMEIGQAAGTAVALALDGSISVQNVDFAALQARLIADGALVGWPVNPGPPWQGTAGADFNDFSPLPLADIRNHGGGFNLLGTWDDTGTQKVVAGDLTTTVGGYSLEQVGDGDAGKLQGVYNARRLNSRDIAGQMQNEVWFSVLVQNPDATAKAGLAFNPESNGDPAQAALRNFFELAGSTLQITLGGVTTNVGGVSLATGQTHLILGRMVLEGGVDTFQLWADPADLLNLGDADYELTGTDFMDLLAGIGTLTYNPGGVAWSAQGGYLDALRLSNEPGLVGLAAVTGVPEPATLALMAAGLALVLRRRRR